MVGERKPYVAPRLRQITDPQDVARILGLAAEENPALLVSALKLAHRTNANANDRARRWKALAKKLWHTTHPLGSMGRHGCAAIDVRMTRAGR